ncbi:hypothetical protein BN1723_005633 [Verticillium longisporum]|uniref:GAT domain-containing protein n=1 Tax=Verticillium longisporum TaxID=100787 RepID=A0A0G4N9X4_VERLO|nr:hypothetical protein BN1723_005633 [Verticillium longisporum]
MLSGKTPLSRSPQRFEFCNVVKDVLRNGRDPSVRQILMETLDDFEQTRTNDEGVKDLVYMWKKEKERAFQRGERNFRYPQGAHSAPQMTASQYNDGGHNSNYFARSHSNRRLPGPAELASRLEEARNDEGKENTRSLGLVVARGTLLVLVSPVDGSEPIANPFAQPEED